MSAAGQRYWDEVAAGEELPGFSLPLTMTRMALQVSGTQDFYPVHHDAAVAREAGHQDIFINTSFIRACLCRVLTDWVGAEGCVRRLGFQMRAPNFAGEAITARGRVTEKRPDGRVELEVWIENVGKGITAPGSATVTLPVRR
jgi:acyl dehydratase